jgi:glycosyltransferase involved in cell wall biosynthesis
MKSLLFALFSLPLVFSALYAETQKTIGIMLYKVMGAEPWDPETVKKGITGSEEAVIYISKELVKLGYKVIVYGDPPKGSLHSMPAANPRYVPFNSPDEQKLDIAISWRMPHKAAEFKKRAAKVYLWPHDTFYWKLSEEQINGFDGVLWVSEWQRQQWISYNSAFAKFTKIFGNGIVPQQFKPVAQRENPWSCIYGSNYGRGLEVLLQAWPNIKKQFPQATLDLYYGWQHWGTLTKEKEAALRKMVAELEPLAVKEHGLVSHEELNRAYEKASFWTYPCIAPEVFCISAIRAQLAGAVPVIILGSGLYETVPHGYACKSVEEYEATLLRAMQEAEKISLEERKAMGEFVLKNYTWEQIAQNWKELFEAP